MAKISNQMATEISLSTIKVTAPLKELRSAITATTNTWKNLSAAQKATGDNFGALKTKAEGLSKTMQLQQQRIDELKNKQNELTNGLGITADTTEKVKQKYQSYQNQINRLTAQMANESKQLEQTNQQIKYQESGLASLQKSMKDSQAVTQSMVERLKAEGQDRKALKVQIEGEKTALDNLNKQYRLQETELGQLKSKLNSANAEYKDAQQELNKIASSSGKASKEYQSQATRVKELQRAVEQANSDFKTQQVRLNNTAATFAKTSTKVKELKNDYSRIPKFIKTTINADTSKAQSNVKELTSTIKGVGIGTVAAQAGMAALSAVTNQFGDAVSRYDTLNNFPKILESMGASAKDANASMEILKKGVDGLPTSLDTVAKTSEKLLPMSKNAQDASKSAIALNDAFLASKASSEDASRGLEQYTQMLSAGKVDLQSWKTLQETMPASLTKVAKSFGIASGSTKELYNQLKAGKITMTQLNQKFQELDGGVNGFHQEAKTASDGIGTAMANMKNRVTKALADVMTGFDQLSKEITGKGIAQNINDLSSKFADFGKAASKAIAGLAPTIKTLIQLFNQWKPVILGVISAFAGFKILTTIKNMVIGFQIAFASLTAVMEANPFVAIASAIIGIGVALVAAYNKCKWFRDGVNNVFNAIKITFKAVGDTFKDIGSTIGGVFSSINSVASHCASWVGSHFDSMVKTMSDATNRAKSFVASRWDDMKNAVSDAVTAITDKNSKLHDDMINKISDATGVSKKTLNDGYNAMSDYTTTFKDLVTGKWSALGGDIKRTASDLASTAKDIFSGMYNKLNDLTGGGLDKIKNAWSKMWTNIVEGINNAVKNVGHAVSRVVNNVIEPVNKMLDGVKSGVNWVLDKFGASKWSGYHIPEVHLATGGTVGKGGTMALVNDAPGKNYREMFATPDGKIGAFPKDRNVHTFLPEGTQVLDGERSKQLADMLEIPHFKDGTKDKGLFGNIFDKAFDLFDKIKDVISHPFEFLEQALTKNLHISTNVKFAADMIAKAPSFFAKQGINWLKKMAEDWKKKKEEESVGGFGSIKDMKNSAELRDLVKAALEANGLSTDDSMIARVMRQIATESGGNAHAVQPGADPDGDGSGPAMGLMQTKRSTFNAYKAPGHDDIFNAYDNLLAALNYAKHRYGPSLSFLGNGHGYANGGFINHQQIAMIGEQNKPEVVIPLSKEKQGRALDLLTGTVNKLNRNAGRRTQVTSQNTNSSIERKLDTMISLLGSILGVNQQQLNSGNRFDLNGLYKKMYKDQQLNNYQTF